MRAPPKPSTVALLLAILAIAAGVLWQPRAVPPALHGSGAGSVNPTAAAGSTADPTATASPGAVAPAVPQPGRSRQQQLTDLFTAPSARGLMTADVMAATDADLRELRSAVLLACSLANNKDRSPRSTEPAHLSLQHAFATAYCAGMDSGMIRVERASGLLSPPNPDDSVAHLSRGQRLLDELETEGASERLARDWLDLLATTPFPTLARYLATGLLDRSGPLGGVLESTAPLQFLDGPRVGGVINAVAELLACSNGPLCAPNRAYAMALCIEHGNCMPGATLVDIRRDLVSPYDWRLAQRIAAEIRARHSRHGRPGG